ncbi:MAG TPA: hypothetical protein VK465_01010, partial [Fibrobacteria bacterium]|nr:hypothetical protein [Fibrobacteria bacterium]
MQIYTRHGSGRLLALLLFAVLLPGPARGEAYSALLEGLTQTIASRWDFQARHPLATKAFSKSLSETERRSLESALRAEPTRQPLPAPGAAPGPVSLPDLWREFTLGLCGEDGRPGGGEVDLQSAALRAHGSVPVTYEMARILQGMGMYRRATDFQKEVQRSLLEQGYVRAPELAKMELRRAREALAGNR